MATSARETAEQRRARIRRRLAEQDEPKHPLLSPAPQPDATNEGSDNPSDEPDGSSGRSAIRRPSVPTPSGRSVGQAVVQRRQNKPTNYKIHVITALGLTLAIRIMALGPKAAFGGK